VVQIRVKPSDSMMRLMLQASNPKKYGRLSRGGATRGQIERKLRKKIEAEVHAEIEAKRGGPPRDVRTLIDAIAARVEEIEAEAAAAAEEAGRRPEGEGSEAA
jgi:hypothetical protein